MKHIEGYFEGLLKTAGAIRVTDERHTGIPFTDGIERAYALISSKKGAGASVLIIGNGGSASIASHVAIDLWKNCGIKAHAFNDSSLLTCIGNDFGYAQVFAKPIEMFTDRGDVLIAISSSGRSENILRGADAARSKGADIITLSGFEADNPLSKMGGLNFYVPSNSYGPVEVIHMSICHLLIDMLSARKA